MCTCDSVHEAQVSPGSDKEWKVSEEEEEERGAVHTAVISVVLWQHESQRVCVCFQVQHLPPDAHLGPWLLFLQVGQRGSPWLSGAFRLLSLDYMHFTP